jgi:catechol-2,3-dioxygenase
MSTHEKKGSKKNYAPPGMFEVTKQMDKAEDLDTWVEHFKAKGIKTKIVTNDNGKFILCREGVESKT